MLQQQIQGNLCPNGHIQRIVAVTDMGHETQLVSPLILFHRCLPECTNRHGGVDKTARGDEYTCQHGLLPKKGTVWDQKSRKMLVGAPG
ncbi:hypothetical protein O181_032395, partial [Austropuccinia psidii MF-1]|nr:hypothetical protein [Austropuccinia psidii MF-1]